MATEGCFTLPFTTIGMAINCFIILLVSNLISSYSYPLFSGKRYSRPIPIRRSSYLPLPVSRHYNEYQLPDYEDVYMNSPQDEYEYTGYEKYPFVQYFGYHPTREYYHDKTLRRSLDNYGYFDDQLPQESMDNLQDDVIHDQRDDIYPYGQENWYDQDLPSYDSNAEANAAFLQNLIMAQMYQDARNKYQYAYDSVGNDYDDQNWFYGVPTTEVEDKEKVKQYFKNKEDEEVRELQSLARKKGMNKKMKEKESYKKQKNAEAIEKPTKPKSKMTDDEYFDMQKQIIVNSRKNNNNKNYVSVAEGLRLNKKQIYDPVDANDNVWDLYKSYLSYYPEAATNSIKKLNLIKDEKNTKNVDFSDRRLKVETTAAAATAASVSSTTAPPKRIATVGQKEFVLPRPSNPVRRPFGEISTRSLHQPSVYDTIKKLLNMEKDLQKSDKSQPQKRFVLNEDQLTAELNGLKKLSA